MKFDYLKPHSLTDVLKLLVNNEEHAAVVAGGTNILLQIKHHKTKGRCWACQACTYPGCPKYKLRPPEILISLNALEELKQIRVDSHKICLGAGITITELLENVTLNSTLPLFKEVAKRVAYREVRNIATLGGNICNADPLADFLPPLLALDATLKIASADGEREQKLSTFVKGRNKVALSPREILVDICFDTGGISGIGYHRIATRKFGGRAIAVAAVVLSKVGSNTVLRIGTCGLGSRAAYFEYVLNDKPNSKIIYQNIVDSIKPVKMWGYSLEYRKDMLAVAIQEAIKQCMEGSEFIA